MIAIKKKKLHPSQRHESSKDNIKELMFMLPEKLDKIFHSHPT